MTRLLVRSSVRHARRHPGQLALTVLGVCLGVAIVVGMDLAVQSNRTAFRASAEAVSGRATHHVVGGAAGLDEEVFAAVRLRTGVLAAPVVEGYVFTERLRGRALRVLGVDPLSEGPFRPYLGGSGSSDSAEGGAVGAAAGAGFDATTIIGLERAVVVHVGTAREAGVDVGDTLALFLPGRSTDVVVAGTLGGPREGAGSSGLRDAVITDVAWAQEILGELGRLTRIDLRVPEGRRGEAALEAVRALLPADARVEPAGTRSREMEEMIAAFDLNLTALSLLAMVFGVFLIYNALTFSVVQRREALGVARALGVTRRELFRLVLGEAAVVGGLGSVLGVGLGVVMGRGLVRMVTRTINDLYFVVSVEGLSVPPLVLLKGVVIGIGATLLAAALPAREAAGVQPRAAFTRSVIEERWRSLVPTMLWTGAGLLLVGSLVLAGIRDLGVSFGALFAVVVGMALVTPAATVVLMRLARPAVERVAGVLGVMAARGVVTTLSRTAPAIASLVVAVSVTVGLGVMIQSFRGTLVRWLDHTLQADVYVSPPSVVSARAEGELDPAVVRLLTTTDGVVGVSTYRGTTIPSSSYGETRLIALDLHPLGEAAFDFEGGGAEAAMTGFRERGAVIVSEPFSYRHGVGVGDSVALPTPRGERRFPVSGVFFDYGSERGVVMMARATYDGHWDDPAVTSLGLFLDSSEDGERALQRLRTRLAEADIDAASAVTIRSNAALRSGSLTVFDRTFAITEVLRGLAFLVAFIGVLSALMALQLERGRELGVLRANGLTPGQVWQLVTAQTGLIGGTAGVLAAPAGLALAVVMIHVVNKRSFGWTLRMELDPVVFAQAFALSVAGALLAGIYPAWKMSRTSPAVALREE